VTIQDNSQLLARRLIKTTVTIGVDMALIIFALLRLRDIRNRNPGVREPKIQNKSARV
jgi:hypothetical protein